MQLKGGGEYIAMQAPSDKPCGKHMLARAGGSRYEIQERKVF